MNISLRTALKPDSAGQVQVRKRAAQMGMPDPISVRALANQISPDSVVFTASHTLSAGDISAQSVQLGIASNGAYFMSGTCHDTGILFGDNYVVTVVLNFVDATGMAIAFQATGTLDPRDSKSWRIEGFEPNLVSHWEDIKAKGVFLFRLHVSADVTVANVLGLIGQLGAITLLLLAGGAASMGKGHWEGGTYVIPLDD